MSKRILFYTPIFPPHYSGATFQAISLAKSLRSKGYGITFLCLRETDKSHPLSAYGSSTHDNFDVLEIPIRNYREPYTLKKHLELVLRLFCVLFLNRRRYDIIHSHNFQFPYAAIGLAGRLFGKRTCCKITMSGDLDFDRIGRATGFLYGHLVHSFNRVISISGEITSILRTKGFADRAIASIPNGVDTDRFKPVSDEVKKELKSTLAPGSGPLVLFVGGITYRKGVDDLMEIWRRTHDSMPDATLLLLGPRSLDEGATGDEYCYDMATEFVKCHALEDSVRFLGRVKDVVPYLQCADALVLPSKLEGMPNVVLEAMACGVPCIVNNVSGVPDIIDSGVSGEIITDNDIETFGRKLVAVATNPEKRAEYSRNALSTIENRFSLESVSARYADLYSTL